MEWKAERRGVLTGRIEKERVEMREKSGKKKGVKR